MNISKNKHSHDILARLADALANHGPIDNARDLTAEADREIETAREHAEALRAKSLDPALSSGEAASARDECSATVFHADRLVAALDQLEARIAVQVAKVKEDERQERRTAAMSAVAALADRISREYGPLARQMAALAAEVAQVDGRVASVNAERSDAEPRLSGPDGTARAFLDFGEPFPVDHGHFRIKQCVIPHPEYPKEALWPPVPLDRLRDLGGILSHEAVCGVLRGKQATR
jgi:hypothetical protein